MVVISHRVFSENKSAVCIPYKLTTINNILNLHYKLNKFHRFMIKYSNDFSIPPKTAFQSFNSEPSDDWFILRPPQEVYSFYQHRKHQYYQKQTNQLRNDRVKEIQYPIGTYVGEVLTNSQSIVRNGEGIFMYHNGDAYFGSWRNNEFHNYGIYMFQSGQIYEGEFFNGRKNGQGIFYYDSGVVYHGYWANDQKQGFGTFNSPQQYFEGIWQNNLKALAHYHINRITKEEYFGKFNGQGQKEGKGKLILSDGSVYIGNFTNDIFEGFGELEYANKDKYIGNFNQGRKDGEGTYYYSEGTVFKGFWANDEKIKGQLILFNGDIFNGDFKHNTRFEGIYFYKNDDKYEGCWLDELKEGEGILILHNNESYHGNFHKGQKHGHGLYKWANGDEYEGQFLEDKRQGLGVYHWNEGGFYRGQWAGDRMNGYGRLSKGGIDVIGEFYADHFVREVEAEQLENLRGFILE